jgi:RNA ligase
VAFEKLDGTNLFWEWHREFGWTDFGPRSGSYRLDPGGVTEFHTNHPGLEQAPELFATLGEQMHPILEAQPGIQHAVAYTEFLGERSFAGSHAPDDPKRLVFFDLFIPGYGFVGPWRFLELFAGLPLPRVVYQGKFTGKLTEDVRAGKYAVAEGVVIKGGTGGADVWMAKVKTNAYLEKLKAHFGDRWEEYWE